MCLSSGRVKRRISVDRSFTKNSYRKAKPYLLEDFQLRCAYSMQHMDRAGGSTCMEVEHFDPRKKAQFTQKYIDLNLASRHCNGAKGTRFLSGEIRLLNPSNEEDYGTHIVEDPVTHELRGVTPRGTFHIRVCALNAPHLVRERKERSKINTILSETPAFVMGSLVEAGNAIAALRQQFEKMIPLIPAGKL